MIVSSAPQIRYPDCYGIDMSNIDKFIAFRAARRLHRDRGQEQEVIQDIYQKCVAQRDKKDGEIVNYVKALFDPFTDEEISDKIAEMLKTEAVNSRVEVIYQSVEDLHKACPNNLGDWYFTGDYPTDGGHRVVNEAFINFVEGNDKRAY